MKDAAVEHQPRSIVAAPFERRLERRIELGQRHLGEKPEAAEVDAEDGMSSTGERDAVGHAEQRAVAAEDEEQVDRGGEVVAADGVIGGPARRQSRRCRLRTPARRRARSSHAAISSSNVAASVEPCLGDDPDATDRTGLVRYVSGHRAAPERGNGRRTRGCLRRRRSATASWPAATSPMRPPRADTSSTTRAWTDGSATTPPLPTSSRPASNCGFTSAMTSAARQQRHHAGRMTAEK